MVFLIRTGRSELNLNPDAHDDLTVYEVAALEQVHPANLTWPPGHLDRRMIGEKRIFALLALILGIIAAALILSAATRGSSLDVLGLLVGLGVLYGSYLIFRGKTSLLMGWAKTRTGAVINLVLGVATLVIPGGVGGTASILAIVSGVLGLLAA